MTLRGVPVPLQDAAPIQAAVEIDGFAAELEQGMNETLTRIKADAER